MSKTKTRKEPENNHGNGTNSISFKLNDGREAEVGVFPKGLATTFTFDKKIAITIIEGIVDFNGVGISKGNVYVFDPAQGETLELHVWCPYTDVAYKCIYG